MIVVASYSYTSVLKLQYGYCRCISLSQIIVCKVSIFIAFTWADQNV